MVVLCVEADDKEIIKDFVKDTHERLIDDTTSTMMVKTGCFAYYIEDRGKLLIIYNIETSLFTLPKYVMYFIMKLGLKKYGYKGKTKLVNNNYLVVKLAKVFKDLPGTNNKMVRK